MEDETIKHLKDSDFKWLTGVQRETLNQIRTVIEKGLRDFGRLPKLSRADQLLTTLLYWLEFHKNSQALFKKSKYHALTKREKQSIRSLT